MTPKMITSSALTLIVAMGATSAAAQDNASGSSDPATTDQDIMEKIEAADAPDTAETDPVNETESNEIGATTQMAQPNDMQGSAGIGAILDLETLSHDIYERGYRQGYIRGVQEARQDFAMQLNYLAKREQLTESYQDWQTKQSDGSGSDQAQTGDSNNQQDENSGSGSENQQAAANETDTGTSSQNFDINRRSSMMGARPGGTIVVLPDGVTPEQFIENLVDSRNNAMQAGSGR